MTFFSSEMDARKPRRTETPYERQLRLERANNQAMDRALAEQDKLDAQIRRSIKEHGA